MRLLLPAMTPVVVTFLASVAWSPLQAAPSDADVDALYEALALGEMLTIMRDEGLTYGASIGEDLLPGPVTPEWEQAVAQIYNLDAMISTVRDGLGAALGDSDVDAMIAFFEAEPGREIVELEIAARRALMDESIEEASKEAAALAFSEETDRSVLIKQFVETNDLVDSNVVGALNANFAFFSGLRSGGGIGDSITDEQLLRDVWQQEPKIRQNTAEWVYSYSFMAYQPLTDDVLRTYIAFSQTDAGDDLNAALFRVFDKMFEDISGALGRAASQQMLNQEL